jgi:hypothetical protein
VGGDEGGLWLLLEGWLALLAAFRALKKLGRGGMGKDSTSTSGNAALSEEKVVKNGKRFFGQFRKSSIFW